MNQRILLAIVDLFILALLVYVGYVWASPFIASGDWFAVALVVVAVFIVWSIVKS